jgi:hypothetical protein
MHFDRITHIVTPDEIKTIATLGFSVEGSASSDPVAFINTHFPNFDLLPALKVINDTLTPTTSKTVYRKIIFENASPPKLEIQFYSSDYADPDAGIVLVRSFLKEGEGPIVKHEFFRLPKPFRNRGISKIVLTALFQQYVNIGARKILVHAALQDGGLVWAKQYFMATDKKEVDVILQTAGMQLPAAQYLISKAIYDDYYSKDPTGQAFPIYRWAELPFMQNILRGQNWHGAVDLTNPEEFSNFVKNAIG